MASPKGLHSGLRGNVSTYRLNTEDIAKMADGQIMPPSPSILAATISVTLLAQRTYRKRTMPGFLRVNRARVCAALVWLKKNNPLYTKTSLFFREVETRFQRMTRRYWHKKRMAVPDVDKVKTNGYEQWAENVAYESQTGSSDKTELT
ncbi:hypothetical protein EDB85DRAFT_1894966 [Lactarius pseudohatsudake]|nr:hypothetical protein EDB85DRAFT_1894966 [Lactarius pseudohatsudake]